MLQCSIVSLPIIMVVCWAKLSCFQKIAKRDVISQERQNRQLCCWGRYVTLRSLMSHSPACPEVTRRNLQDMCVFLTGSLSPAGTASTAPKWLCTVMEMPLWHRVINPNTVFGMEMVGDNNPFIFTSQRLLIFTNKKTSCFPFWHIPGRLHGDRSRN